MKLRLQVERRRGSGRKPVEYARVFIRVNSQLISQLVTILWPHNGMRCLLLARSGKTLVWLNPADNSHRTAADQPHGHSPLWDILSTNTLDTPTLAKH
ncbi:2473_t:CDS:2 [Acaulospora colombiana]|uniref:2473_t:CDS:1 n=1 Tax=Acaulospora colombiana TaxID=27376 RepID=A0ACA9Q509_9GLOM|nr:2473_t:CDS:2 [Acaulospora colombiana]